ncbi:hypothetical protein BDU57DRAFT_584989 [Ampelomyces quisqualis]|uniref:KOW domain-containing protein n=1 Tax=Ampelomyces quisqualis TaxID=50730 RepID=A0A6A5R304_AMPQU|nr:hypothetical protein BDU57DRAFT_584989 [Ampelomyces quisqualis]
MSPLVVRPGRNAAREAKRLKEIRKVKGAILWSERERTKRQKRYRERWESTQAFQNRVQWKRDNIIKVREKALENAREDWRLGALRPNRAYGRSAKTYGTLVREQTQKPHIPVHTQKLKNEQLARRGLEPRYPLIVDDKKYFHIVPEDRVVVLRGRERGKIGKVQSVLAPTHEVLLEGLNKQYFDSALFNDTDEQTDLKRESEMPIPIDDVRLVVPYEITERVIRRDGLNEVEQYVKVYKDVIVDRVVLERHTTGIDPFTGSDYGDAEIPKEHQYDPLTGLPIFHRYIAGTRQRIEWPGEKEEELEDIGVTEEEAADKQTWIRRIRNAVLHPIDTYKSSRFSKPNSVVEQASVSLEDISTELKNIEAQVKDARKTDRPKSHDARFASAIDDVDTTRNIVEDPTPIQYRLVTSPFPEDFGEELRAHRQEFRSQSRKDMDDAAPAPRRIKRTTEQGKIASELAKAKRAAAQSMKTPMQLRWEMEHAKKVKQKKKGPLVSVDDLLAALDKHLKQKNSPPKAQPKTAELD